MSDWQKREYYGIIGLYLFPIQTELRFVIKWGINNPLSKKKAPSILYLLANYYSLASGILVKQNEQYVTKSLEYLEEAIRRENYLRIMAKKDPDFDNIKNEDFYELTQE